MESLVLKSRSTPSAPSPFDLVCSRLTHLTLDGPHIPWSSSIFSSLQYVSLTVKKDTLKDEDTDILQIFRNSPALETFRLHSQCSFLGDEQPSLTPLSLPRLWSLDLKLPASNASFILSSVQMSAKLNLVIMVLIPNDTSNSECTF